MSQYLFVYFSLLIMLPMLAVQVRLLIYKRTRTGDEGTSLVEALLEATPHDLSIMGMTLGMAASLLAVSQPAPRELAILFPLAVVVPLFAVSLIPSLKSSALRLTLGGVTYALGALAFVSIMVWQSGGHLW